MNSEELRVKGVREMENYSMHLPSYSIGDNVYEKIPAICESYGTKVVAIGGYKAIASAKEKIEKACIDSDIEILDFIWYGGESSYENVEALKLLEGYIDVYLPDLKYYDNELGKRLSGINNYFEYATESINEMYRQVGSPEIDENGLIKKGLIIRHLVLPNNIENSKNVLKWIKDTFDEKILVSVMAQYFPSNKAMEYEELNRKLTEEEYNEIEDFVFDLNLDGYMQDLEENEEKYVPNFD